MRIGPLTLLNRRRTNDGKRAGLLIASVHWQNSITWRWALTLGKANTLIPYGFGRARTYKSAPGWNGSLTLNLPILGYFHLTIQPNKFQPGWKAYS